MAKLARYLRGHWFPLVPILLLFVALVAPTLGHQGVNWDEQTDLDIASVYADSAYGLLHGSRDDIINTRLPMFSAGLLFRLLNGDPLLLARALSVAVSVLAMLGVYVFCARELGRAKAVVSVLLLATSPYFQTFGKQALTEGDAWITAAVAWLLLPLSRFRENPTAGRAAWVGLALGLALSAKISGLALVAAFGAMMWFERRAWSGRGEGAFRPAALLMALTGFFVWIAVNALVSVAVYEGFGLSLESGRSQPLLRLVAGLLLAGIIARWIHSIHTSRAPAYGLFLIACLVSGLCFFLIPPVHTTNPWILGALGIQFLSAESSSSWQFRFQSAGFHAGVIAIKSSLGIGFGMLLAWLWALARARRERALQPLLWISVFYTGFVLLLPWAQTRYMMPVYPLLAIFAAHALVELHRARRKIAHAVGAVALGLLAVDFAMCYPDLNLNGYPLLGERYLAGRATVGYRSIVHTPSDGIEQSLRWLRERAEPGETLMTVFGEAHITRRFFSGDAWEVLSPVHGAAALDRADWVLTSINYEISNLRGDAEGEQDIYDYPFYDRAQLEREFECVFQVERAFGIQVAAVWQRRVEAGGGT